VLQRAAHLAGAPAPPATAASSRAGTVLPERVLKQHARPYRPGRAPCPRNSQAPPRRSPARQLTVMIVTGRRSVSLGACLRWLPI
jgi:hypothetical protein